MHLLILNGNLKGQTYKLDEGEILIGRSDPSEKVLPAIDLAPADDDVKVSRRHAIIRRKNNVVTIEDAGSLNGTYLNRDQKLSENDPVTLRDRDEILIGKVLLRFEMGE